VGSGSRARWFGLVVGGDTGFLAAPVGVAFEDEFVGGGLEPVDR